MVKYYEYSHPIINESLQVRKARNRNESYRQARKFKTLEEWYNVLNDYEYQSRCPIVLKNSHRNKHYTFACQRKSCPFRIWIGYEYYFPAEENAHDPWAEYREATRLRTSLDDGGNGNDIEWGMEDAIDNAVASVRDPTKPEGSGDEDDMAEFSGKGFFVINKAVLKHNHSLSSNLSLSQLVLTKTVRILQHDMKFDQVLERLYQCDEDGSSLIAVSYTHLDVYKRQTCCFSLSRNLGSFLLFNFPFTQLFLTRFGSQLLFFLTLRYQFLIFRVFNRL